VSVVTLAIGQRTDVLVTGLSTEGKPGAVGAYQIRSSIATYPCSLSSNPDALAIAYYDRDASFKPITTKPWPEFTAALGVCKNVSRLSLRIVFG
jgi:hypothetical protein